MKCYLSSYLELCIENNAVDAGFSLYINNVETPTHLVHREKDVSYFEFPFPGETLGHELKVLSGGEECVVDVTPLAQRKDFDIVYGNDHVLGPVYTPEKTTFNLWAPLASKVVLLINEKEFELVREDKGIYTLSLDGDYDGMTYIYRVTINGEDILATDPFAKSAIANQAKSAVVDLSKITANHGYSLENSTENPLKNSIYECHIRDFTIHADSTIKNKGKYLGFVEEGCKTIGGNPFGIDLIKHMDFTHVQILPVLDFGSVNEITNRQYNWGYDPMSFFVLEGSYSSNPNDPYSRIKEFNNLVQGCHKNNIRVVLDVVYNHVYKWKEFNMNKITPNYFFRKEKNGKMQNHSGCGNDFASERYMARRAIVESCNFLVDTYDIDGLRFDLMGLIDLETIKQVEETIHAKKPDALIYGEGWEMFAGTFNEEKCATMLNSELLPNVGFFNDSFRDILRGHGSTSELDDKGFLLGNASYGEGFKFAFLGSSYDVTYPHKFVSPYQSINYVECHDNATLYDCISDLIDGVDPLRVCKAVNKALFTTIGIPFVHMGQEIGQSKHSQHNTYNMGDYYNQLNPNLVDERFELVNCMAHYCSARKQFDYLDDFDIKNIVFTILKPGILAVEISDKYMFVFNTTDSSFGFENTEGYRRRSEPAAHDVIVLSPHRTSWFIK